MVAKKIATITPRGGASPQKSGRGTIRLLKGLACLGRPGGREGHDEFTAAVRPIRGDYLAVVNPRDLAAQAQAETAAFTIRMRPAEKAIEDVRQFCRIEPRSGVEDTKHRAMLLAPQLDLDLSA